MSRLLSATCLERLRPHLLLFLLLFGLSSCTSVNIYDVEYSERLRNARTNCQGNEIVGVWVSTLGARCTLLIRPGGTGIMRTTTQHAKEDKNLNWRYKGGGKWQYTYTTSLFGSGSPYYYCLIRKNFIQYDGRCLLLEDAVVGTDQKFVFVRAEDETAVEEHLRKRHQ